MAFSFGIIGTGMIADFHAKAIAAIPEGRGALAACFDSNRERSEAFGRTHGCAASSTLDAFLRHPGLQIVTVCTPSGAHMDASVAAAAAGKHLIVEKPLEITTDRCDRIIEACRKSGVLLAGVFPSRFHDAARAVKHAVDAGRFGTLTMGSAYVRWFRSQEYYDKGGWHGTWALDGGGALMNQSIHAVDLLQWLMGPVQAVQSYAGTLAHQRIEVEDTAVAAVRFANGALGTIEGTTASYPGFYKRVVISGTRGSAILEEESLKAWEFADPVPQDEVIRRELADETATGGGAGDPGAIAPDGHRKQFEDFLRALQTGGRPLVDGAEARKAVQIIEAIYRSARESRAVTVG